MNANFKKWYDDADMPMKDENGKWYDAEDGLPFVNQAPAKPRRTVSNKAQSARDIAKNHGGKALTGSAKQKEWGEQVRAEKLQAMTAEQAAQVCSSTLTASAHFWIENRAVSASDIAEFIETARRLRAQFDAAERGTDAARAIAAEYNNLTARFGF